MTMRTAEEGGQSGRIVSYEISGAGFQGFQSGDRGDRESYDQDLQLFITVGVRTCLLYIHSSVNGGAIGMGVA